MTIHFHRQFSRHFTKRVAHDDALARRFKERVQLFISNSSHPLLRDHALLGDKEGFRAFSITADIRVVYVRLDKDTIQFYDIGSHNQVY